MIHNPFYLKVVFDDGQPAVERTYTRGASEAVWNMSKAIDHYTKKGTPCKVSLYDHNSALIIAEAVTSSGAETSS